MGYTKDTIKGVGWVGFLRIFTRGISFLRTLILARILTPSQFGIFGIAILATSLLEVFTETGVNVLLIQEKDDIKKYLNSAWIVSIIRGFLIGSIIFLSASFVSSFFKSPDSRILLQLISIVPIIRGFINPSSVKFQKYLEFHKEFYYRSSIFFFDALVTIIFAFFTRSVLALVFGILAGVILEVILSFLIIKPVPYLSFNRDYLFKIFHRGKWVTLGGIFNYLYYNLDNIVVGKILGATSLGFYEMAYRISLLPITEVADVVQKVVFPVYSKISEDRERLKKAFAKTLFFISLLSISIGVMLFFFAKDAVFILLGDQWAPIIPVLRILAVFGVVRSIFGSTAALFLSVNKQEYVTAATFVSIFGLIITIVPLVLSFGILGAGISALIGTLLSVPVFAFFSYKVLYGKTN
ncbi:MAG: lipopolysaccharide biosynthesis protein [Candidatus Levybacteria bacterium]|nr:lipopolysaccharide biosynthesis protein [Candidatus Levybacteria bacterium]